MEKRRTRSPRARRKPKADTADIVGQVRPPRISNKWRKHYERLVELRDHFLRRQTELSRDALEENPIFSTHMADAGTDNYDRDFALGMLSSEQDATYQIEQDLDRILNGTYGICELTGKPIEAERLEAIPWTRFSAAAERQLEQEGRRKRATLGPRETVTKVQLPTETDETS
jgi:DnaK suppressor protein